MSCSQGILIPIKTKVDREIELEDIRIILQNKIVNTTEIDLPPECRMLVEYFIQQENKVAIFKKATKFGPLLPSDLDDGVLKSITHTEALCKEVLSNSRMGISYESEKFLMETHNDLAQLPELDVIFKALSASCRYELSNESELDDIKDSITVKLQKLDIRGGSIVKMLKVLGGLDESVDSVIESSGIFTSLEFIKFIESMRPDFNHKGIIQNHIIQGLNDAKAQLNRSLIEVNRIQGEITLEEANQYHMQLEAQEREIKTQLTASSEELHRTNNEIACSRLGFMGRLKHVVGGIGLGLTAVPIKAMESVFVDADKQMARADNVVDKFFVAAGTLVAAPTVAALGMAAGVVILPIVGVFGGLNKKKIEAKKHKLEVLNKISSIESDGRKQSDELKASEKLKVDEAKRLQDEKAKLLENMLITNKCFDLGFSLEDNDGTSLPPAASSVETDLLVFSPLSEQSVNTDTLGCIGDIY